MPGRYLAYGTKYLVALAALLVWSVMPARAQALDALKDKTIRVVIGTAPGNGTDVTTRAFVAALRKLLPTTTFRVQNVNGAGGGIALKEVQGARGDVITLGAVGNGPVYGQMLSPDDAPYDLNQMKWVGSLNDNQRILFIRNGLGEARLDTLRALGRQPIATSSDATSPSTVESLLLSAMTGIRLKVVPGVADTMRDTMLMAGNVDVIVSNYASRRAMMEQGVLIPVLRMGEGAYPPAANALPTLAASVRPGVPADLVYFMETLNRVNGLVAAAPSTGAAEIAALQAAFELAIADSEYVAQMTAGGLVVGLPTPGPQLAEIIARLFASNGGMRALVRTYLDCGQKISDGTVTECR